MIYPRRWSFYIFKTREAGRRTLGTVVCDRLQYDPCQVVPSPDFQSGEGRGFIPGANAM